MIFAVFNKFGNAKQNCAQYLPVAGFYIAFPLLLFLCGNFEVMFQMSSNIYYIS